MVPLRKLSSDMTSEQYLPAVLLGVASVPVTVGVNWVLTPDTLPRTSEGFAILVACVLTGYIYRSRTASSTRAGAITGFVGGLPIILWQSAIGFNDWWGHPTIVRAVGESLLMAVAAGGAALLTAVVLSAIFLLTGIVAGSAGSWLIKRFNFA